MKKDPELHNLLDEMEGLLARMPKEKRLEYFRKSTFPRPLDFEKELNGTKYVIRTFFDETADESIHEKMQRITFKSAL